MKKFFMLLAAVMLVTAMSSLAWAGRPYSNIINPNFHVGRVIIAMPDATTRQATVVFFVKDPAKPDGSAKVKVYNEGTPRYEICLYASVDKVENQSYLTMAAFQDGSAIRKFPRLGEAIAEAGQHIANYETTMTPVPPGNSMDLNWWWAN